VSTKHRKAQAEAIAEFEALGLDPWLGQQLATAAEHEVRIGTEKSEWREGTSHRFYARDRVKPVVRAMLAHYAKWVMEQKPGWLRAAAFDFAIAEVNRLLRRHLGRPEYKVLLKQNLRRAVWEVQGA
jgi:hypothetical protein